MRHCRLLIPLLVLLLLAACSRESRQAIVTRVLPSAGTAAAEGAIVLRTVAVEAAQTNAPVARTVAAEAVRTGGPVARTLVAGSIDIAGTVGADVMTTGQPLAGTVVVAGIHALETRRAAEPAYQCPADTYTVDTPLTLPADISGTQLDAAIAAVVPGSPLVGLGETLSAAARAQGLNTYYVAAHAAYDSAWGTSAAATRKNNLFGYGATPACPFDCAVPFETQAESVDFVTTLVRSDYATPGGRFYTTGTLAGMEPIYSGNAIWAEGIAAIMNLLRQNTPC